MEAIRVVIASVIAFDFLQGFSIWRGKESVGGWKYIRPAQCGWV